MSEERELSSAAPRSTYWIAAGVVVLPILALVLLCRSWDTCGFQGCPDVRELTRRQLGGASLLVDRNGEPFANLLATEPRMVKLASLPPTVREAFLAVEDQRFYKHAGIDWRRVAGATRANLRAGGFEQGFSTITMQIARNLFPERIPGRARTLKRKLLEIRVAREIERCFGKDEILELYLNHIAFGQGTRGIEAASLVYFGHPAESLTLAESALLAALPKAPGRYDPRAHPDAALARRDLVLRLMEKQGRASHEATRAARAEPLGVASAPPPRAQDPIGSAYFAEAVRGELERALGDALYVQPVRVFTTLDLAVQREAVAALEAQLRTIESGKLGAFKGPRYAPGPPAAGTPYLQGAVVVMDVRSGDVLVWLGGRDSGQSQFDRVAGARRLAGSAFKPFVYAAAFGRGFALSQPLLDEPFALALQDGTVWEPRNFGDSYDGRVSVRQALVASKNVPTVHLAEAVGRPVVASLAGRAGIDGVPLDPSMALGTVAVSPLELTAAYTAFAANGARALPRLVLRVETMDHRVLWSSQPARAPVLDAGVAFLVTQALRDAIDRGSGARARGGFRGAAAGKTGTTNDGTDAWFVGYTPELAAGVWVGFDEPRPIVRGATGGRLAAPVWGRLMAAVAGSRKPAKDWPTPIGVVVRQVDPWSGLVLADGCEDWSGSSYREFFLEGFVPASYCPGREEPPVAGFWTDGRVTELAPPAAAEPEDDGPRSYPARLASEARPPR